MRVKLLFAFSAGIAIGLYLVNMIQQGLNQWLVLFFCAWIGVALSIADIVRSDEERLGG